MLETLIERYRETWVTGRVRDFRLKFLVLIEELFGPEAAAKVGPDCQKTESANVDGGMYIGGLFDAGPSLPMVDAGCGDTLRLRFSMPQGTDAGAFYYFDMSLSLP